MKINLQRKAPWLDDVPFLKILSSDCVNLMSGDGVSVSIPVVILAASSDYLFSLLYSDCQMCSFTNTVIHLPSVSGFSLKLFSQILSVGETEELSGEDIETSLGNVEAVLELLSCKVRLVTKLSCSRANRQLKVVSIKSLAQNNHLIKEEFKEVIDVYKAGEETNDFYAQLEVENEVDFNSNEDQYHEEAHQDILFQSIKEEASSQQMASSNKERIKNSLRREFHCSLCDLGFFTSVGLERHTSEKHGDDFVNREFKCVECNLSYYTENSLNKHKHAKHGNELHKDEEKFICTRCDYSCNSKFRFSNHWNEKHTKSAHQASFIDTSTSTTVTLNQMFAFILQCKVCGVVRCSNDSLGKATKGITSHLNKNHHPNQIGSGNLSDLYSVLQKGKLISDQPKLKDSAAMNNFVVDNMATQKVPAIAEFSNTNNFYKKGYMGPYHCLSEGCSFVLDKFSRTTQKLLVNHWASEHGDVKPLLYLDMSTFAIINVKIICNNVGYCKHIGCNQLIFSSVLANYRTYILNHWKNSHSSPEVSFNPNMCKTISSKQVPDITEEEAVALTRKPTLLRMIKNEDAPSFSKCSIPGCGENVILPTYAGHFAQKHKELPLKDILVTTNDGRKLLCQDLFKFAIQCGLCSNVCVGAHVRTSMRQHWLREHKDMGQMSFTDIMPTSSVQDKE